ncbi:hypothetical protein GF357_00320 [Candidatus Dojkabacteria bacterium]|nr:hypothetical protein [Candidatus Dojkabacteria bacterium]
MKFITVPIGDQNINYPLRNIVFAVAASILLIIGTVSFTRQFLTYYFGVKNVMITNVTENSATLIWTSRTPMYSLSQVIGNRSQIFYDDRDGGHISTNAGEANISVDKKLSDMIPQKYYSHHVTLNNLDPDTTYSTGIFANKFFRIGKKLEFTTAEVSNSPATQNFAYGQIYDELANPREDVIVLAQKYAGDQVEVGTSEPDSVVSAVVDRGSGYSLDIGRLYSEGDKNQAANEDMDNNNMNDSSTLKITIISPFGEVSFLSESSQLKPVESRFFGSNYWQQNYNLSQTSSSNLKLSESAFAQSDSDCSYMPLDICSSNPNCEINNGQCQSAVSGEDETDPPESDAGQSDTCQYSCTNSAVCEANGKIVDGSCDSGKVCCDFESAEQEFVGGDSSGSGGADGSSDSPEMFPKTSCKNGVLYECSEDGFNCRLHPNGCGEAGCISVGNDWGRCRSPEEAGMGIVSQEDKIDTEALEESEKITLHNSLKEGSWNWADRKICTSFGVLTQGQYTDPEEPGTTHKDYCAVDMSYAYTDSKLKAFPGRKVIPARTGISTSPDTEFRGCSAFYDSKTKNSSGQNVGCGCYTLYVNYDTSNDSYFASRLCHLDYPDENQCIKYACQAPVMGSTGYGNSEHYHFETLALKSGTDSSDENTLLSKLIKNLSVPDENGVYSVQDAVNEQDQVDPREVFEGLDSANNPDYEYQCLRNHPCTMIEGNCWIRQPGKTCADSIPTDLGVTIFDGEIKEYGLKSDDIKKNGSKIDPLQLIFAANSQDNAFEDSNVDGTMLEKYIEAQGVLTPGEYTLNGFSNDKKSLEVNETSSVRVFYDENQNGVFDADERQLLGDQLDNQAFSIQKEVDYFSLALGQGWNLISLPYVMTGEKTSGISTAAELVQVLNKQGFDVVHISAYRNGKFIPYSIRENSDGKQVTFGTDFNIVPGEGYFVKSFTSDQIKLRGRRVRGELPLDLNSGWNLVGLHSASGRDLMASDIIKQADSVEVSADMIMDWNYGRYNGYIVDENEVYGFDFPIYSLKGYFMRVSEGGLFVID